MYVLKPSFPLLLSLILDLKFMHFSISVSLCPLFSHLLVFHEISLSLLIGCLFLLFDHIENIEFELLLLDCFVLPTTPVLEDFLLSIEFLDFAPLVDSANFHEVEFGPDC